MDMARTQTYRPVSLPAAVAEKSRLYRPPAPSLTTVGVGSAPRPATEPLLSAATEVSHMGSGGAWAATR